MWIVFIVIIVIIFVCVKFTKGQKVENLSSGKNMTQPKVVNAPTPGYNNCPADALINSKYYNRYKSVFDLIRFNGKQPKYKIDWLLKSLDMGRELEANGIYVIESMEKGYPYFCETETEMNRLEEHDGPAIRGSVKGILDLGYFYNEVNKDYFLAEKREYWRNRLIELAQGGNLEAQAALCAGRGMFEKEECEKYRAKYQAQLYDLAENGNPYAQYGVGLFIAKYKSKESMEWLGKAASQGLSDASYYLAKTYESFIYSDEDFNMREKPLEGEEREAIYKKMAECFLKGAYDNNGIMAVDCQCRVASCYEDGSQSFSKNVAQSIYWYEVAAKNGSEYAASCAEFLKKQDA